MAPVRNNVGRHEGVRGVRRVEIGEMLLAYAGSTITQIEALIPTFALRP
jgi:hypothetical protein